MSVITKDAEPARPETRSHSQLSSYLECPRSYQLGKRLRVPRRPGAWLPGGTAVHKVIELYLRHTLEQESGES